MSNGEQTMIHLRETFTAWEQQRDRCFALVSAVLSSLETRGDAFNEVQLLGMAEETLGDTCEFNRLSKLLGVTA